MKLYSRFMSSVMSCAIAVTASLFCSCGAQQDRPSQAEAEPFNDPALIELVDKVYESLSVEERIAQIHSVRSKVLTTDGKLDLELCRKEIPHGVGHVAQFACTQSLTPNQMRDFVRDLQAYIVSCTESKIPAIFHEELITGVSTKGATTYPQQIGVACGWNPELVALKSKYSAESLRAIGGQFALSPMVDIVRTQHFNRGEEGYGEDSYLSSAMAYAFVSGLQGESLQIDGVASTTKHFLGYGGGSELPEKELIEEILMPYEVAMRMAGCKSVMPGYHAFNGETSITNRYFLQDILTRYMGYDGLIVSDYFAIAAKSRANGNPNHFYERAEASVNAGADLELCDVQCFSLIPELVEQGKISAERFEQMVKKNLMMKAKLGLLSDSPRLVAEGDVDLNRKEYVDLAYEMAAQSVVLLKNNGVLPLVSKSKSIALVGPNSDSPWAMFGDYTYPAHYTFFQGQPADLDYVKSYTLREGLQMAVNDGVKISCERGCDWDSTIKLTAEKGGDTRIKSSKMNNLIAMLRTTASTPNWKRAMKIAEDSDVVIAAMGENLSLCGEGRNRKGIALPGEQERFVEELIDAGKPVVLVVFGGRAQLLSRKILDGAAAILQAWYPGQEGGRAVADILTGEVNPSAKLSVSYPATDSRKPLCYNYGEEAMRGLIEFPFGYGLSYTTYDYSNISSTPTAKIGRDEVVVNFTLTNSGKRAGSEVVQLYISPEQPNKNYKPIQLRGFERVTLAPGESRTVTLRFDATMLSYFDIQTPGAAQGVWRTEPAKFTVKIGASSSDIRLTAPLELVGDTYEAPIRDFYLSESMSQAI